MRRDIVERPVEQQTLTKRSRLDDQLIAHAQAPVATASPLRADAIKATQSIFRTECDLRGCVHTSAVTLVGRRR